MVDWDLTLSSENTPSTTFNPANSTAALNDFTGLTATPTELVVLEGDPSGIGDALVFVKSGIARLDWYPRLGDIDFSGDNGERGSARVGRGEIVVGTAAIPTPGTLPLLAGALGLGALLIRRQVSKAGAGISAGA